ncbi:MAG TPA: DUF3422 family protein [Nitrospiraceae bacterium]|jgi:uncharacterized membrane-anchored protein|nr:DUF3422 family protein [Nitrospiraceae bacterium]
MSDPKTTIPDTGDLIRKIHERPQMPLVEWLRAPAHVHYKAFRMVDPPVQRPASREEFKSLLEAFKVSEDMKAIHERFGYGVKVEASGDRLILIWEAHTEYYSYQTWHIPSDHAGEVTFGPMTFPQYRSPVTPLGAEVCRLDILLMIKPLPGGEVLRPQLPGPVLYGSRILDEETALVTSFTPDEHGRERYWVSVGSGRPSSSHLKDIVDAIVRIETYYHMLLMQKPLFSAAIDQAYKFEQVHLKQREIISEHIGHADSLALQRWLNGLTQDLLKTTRLSSRLHFELSAAIPYDKIVHRSLTSLGERTLAPYRPMSEYVLSGITGVAEGYQQLLKRMDTLRSGFEGTISIIRARVDLMLQSQNLSLLVSVDKTTKSQAILQYTVEGLSVIVIAYYLSGLMAYIFKAFQEMGWLRSADIAAALFVPISLGIALGITILGRKLLHKKFSGESTPSASEKPQA